MDHDNKSLRGSRQSSKKSKRRYCSGGNGACGDGKAGGKPGGGGVRRPAGAVVTSSAPLPTAQAWIQHARVGYNIGRATLSLRSPCDKHSHRGIRASVPYPSANKDTSTRGGTSGPAGFTAQQASASAARTRRRGARTTPECPPSSTALMVVLPVHQAPPAAPAGRPYL